ncbi:LysR family transcriptional regulator [Larsenimonas rhizosphaerae]|uniref:LysR family transcriptional regulator n=1 Tax=Larsenimonas rhizosphaerae TaxID=2944682 RepID=A0AA41ZN11_9GAMM|nr:LysR family transcriptional regulator [Larsenimonas rhizosphaerae]MCM2131369.1 LysR family transcriptional regulator [Larsenimonas rhizosphaerae]MCX2525266.1 LysR family transcriptional regulator [Larsenimonas rhizosphaerae]
MEIRWLDDFMALARTRHFSRAAERQHVSQPTFSRRIRLLEEAMGTTLIDRQTLPLSLTPAGQHFLAFCETVSGELALTRERISILTDAALSRLSLAAAQSLFTHFFQDWAGSTGLEPLLSPDLHSTNWIGSEYLDALEQGQCDVALVYWSADLSWADRFDSDRLRWHSVGRERLIPVSLAAITDEATPRFALPGTPEQPVPVMAYHPRSFMAQPIAAHMARLSPTPHLLPLNDNLQSGNVKTLIQQGYGMGWLPARMANDKGLVRSADEAFDVELDIRLVALARPRHSALEALWQQLDPSPEA